MNSGNQPGDLPLILKKKERLLKKCKEDVLEVGKGNH